MKLFLINFICDADLYKLIAIAELWKVLYLHELILFTLHVYNGTQLKQCDFGQCTREHWQKGNLCCSNTPYIKWWAKWKN